MNQLFGTLYNKALEGDADCGGSCPAVICQVSRSQALKKDVRYLYGLRTATSILPI